MENCLPIISIPHFHSILASGEFSHVYGMPWASQINLADRSCIKSVNLSPTVFNEDYYLQDSKQHDEANLVPQGTNQALQDPTPS